MTREEFNVLWAKAKAGEDGWEWFVEDGGYTVRLRNPILKEWAMLNWKNEVQYGKFGTMPE